MERSEGLDIVNLDAGRFSAWARSPLGAILERWWFERLAESAIPFLFRLARVGASARKLVGQDVEAFLYELEPSGDLSRRAVRRARRGLRRFEESFRAHQEADARFERAFFEKDGEPADDEALRALEAARRRLSEGVVYPRRTLGFLARRPVPSIRNRVFPPGEVFSQWAEEIWSPGSLYFAPTVRAGFVSSRSFSRRNTREYFLRFSSPSRFLDDRIQARVIEPRYPHRDIPTVIYCGGLGMSYDLVRLWPEEEYVGHRLAARGFRVVLPESPWHGRRAPMGVASGELPLATSPLGLILLVSAQVQEVGALIHWARSLPSSVVAVGGISIGAVVAQQVAAWSRDWPESLRPDAVFLNGAGIRLDRCAFQSRLLSLLGIDEKMREAGWTDMLAVLLRPMIDPPGPSSLPPDRHVVVLGRRDEFLPYRAGSELVRSWRIPESNVLTWDVGHLGIPLRLAATDEAQEKWVSVLRGAWLSANRISRSPVRESSPTGVAAQER